MSRADRRRAERQKGKQMDPNTAIRLVEDAIRHPPVGFDEAQKAMEAFQTVMSTLGGQQLQAQQLQARITELEGELMHEREQRERLEVAGDGQSTAGEMVDAAP